jgi:hypothetical protein
METLKKAHVKLGYEVFQERLRGFIDDEELRGFDEYSIVVTAKEVAAEGQTRLI